MDGVNRQTCRIEFDDNIFHCPDNITIHIHFFGMVKKKKKTTEKKSNRKGTRPKYSKTTTFEFGDKVYCSNCRKHVVVNAKSEDPSTFLKNRQSQCMATSPRKSVEAEEPVSLDEFVERIAR